MIQGKHPVASDVKYAAANWKENFVKVKVPHHTHQLRHTILICVTPIKFDPVKRAIFSIVVSISEIRSEKANVSILPIEFVPVALP